MRIISGAELKSIISMKQAIECLKDGYTNLTVDPQYFPERTLIRNERNDAFFASMPAYNSSKDKFIIKVASFHLHNKKHDLPSINGVVIIQNGRYGHIEAIIEANEFTALRTAATSGLATDMLATEDAKSVAIIGTGAQAVSQLEAILNVRCIFNVNVYSRNKYNVEKFIEIVSKFTPTKCKISASDSVISAIKGVDIICTATTCEVPLFFAGDVRKGVHINAVGKHTTDSREVPIDLIANSILLVEQRSAAIREAGEYNKTGIEIAEMLALNYARYRERTTVFASVGTAFQDLCVATKISDIIAS